MNGRDPSVPLRLRAVIAAIGVGTVVGGTADLAVACALSGTDTPLAIAAGLVGKSAFRGGAPMVALGIALHFFITLVIASVYYLASRELPSLVDRPIACGLAYGAAVELTMRFVVLPLSALHAGTPSSFAELAEGLLGHMLDIGLPIALSVSRFAPQVASGPALPGIVAGLSARRPAE